MFAGMTDKLDFRRKPPQIPRLTLVSLPDAIAERLRSLDNGPPYPRRRQHYR